MWHFHISGLCSNFLLSQTHCLGSLVFIIVSNKTPCKTRRKANPCASPGSFLNGGVKVEAPVVPGGGVALQLGLTQLVGQARCFVCPVRPAGASHGSVIVGPGRASWADIAPGGRTFFFFADPFADAAKATLGLSMPAALQLVHPMGA